METKNSIRKQIKSFVSSIEDKDYQANLVCKKLIREYEAYGYKSVLCFMPMKDEIDIKPFISYLTDKDINVYVPVSFDNGIMSFYKLQEIDNLVTGKYGISEPERQDEYVYDPNDLIIVPGVAFDKYCNRMGRGKGYYDIFLNKHKLKSIAVCYNEQIIDKVPTEVHDIKMNMVICEKYILKSEQCTKK